MEKITLNLDFKSQLILKDILEDRLILLREKKDLYKANESLQEYFTDRIDETDNMFNQVTKHIKSLVV